jgi:hypothetical protein
MLLFRDHRALGGGVISIVQITLTKTLKAIDASVIFTLELFQCKSRGQELGEPSMVAS